jgi:hypothetical protein
MVKRILALLNGGGNIGIERRLKISYPFNEYKLLQIIKTAFNALKESGSDFDTTFQYLFDAVDLSVEDRAAFKHAIVNDGIKYQTTYANLSVNSPVITVIFDQEVNIESEKPIGYVVGGNTVTNDAGVTSSSDEYGYIEMGAYSINIIAKQILLVRLLGAFVKFILEKYASVNDDFMDMDINVDRFSPDADYFPTDAYHVHLTVRFRYCESWDEVSSPIAAIFMQACDDDFWQNVMGTT